MLVFKFSEPLKKRVEVVSTKIQLQLNLMESAITSLDLGVVLRQTVHAPQRSAPDPAARLHLDYAGKMVATGVMLVMPYFSGFLLHRSCP